MSELALAVEISNRIQAIAREAFQMHVQATNAIVVTRSRGIAVPGFEAVAEQMGQVSRQLAREVEPLRAATVAWIRVASGEIRVARELAMLEAAREAAPRQALRIEAVAGPLRARLASGEDGERERRAFARAVDDVRQTVATGCVLARTAKIEAAYGGTLADALAETADVFTRLADSIDDAVRTIARWIGTATRRAA